MDIKGGSDSLTENRVWDLPLTNAFDRNKKYQEKLFAIAVKSLSVYPFNLPSKPSRNDIDLCCEAFIRERVYSDFLREGFGYSGHTENSPHFRELARILAEYILTRYWRNLTTEARANVVRVVLKRAQKRRWKRR